MANDNELIISITGSADKFIKELDKVKKQTGNLEKVLDKTAKASALAFAGFASSIAITTKAFIDWEKALVGVGKTTNIEGKKLQQFGNEIVKMASVIPIASNELAGIAQAAGQLGVTGEKNLLKFTETVAKLGVATDLSGEQAATTLTRILNTTGESIETIDTFGSVLVALGNNFAATESEIARMANEVARATAVFDVSAAQAAALGTAMKSVGIQAELGGSAVGKTFRTIDEVVRNGGKQFERLVQVTGVTGEQFKKTFAEDSVAGFQLFIEGIGKIVKEGGSAAQVLAEFGLKGDEINKVLPVLAKNSDLVGKTLKTAAKETRNATALNAEAEKAFDTLGSKIQILQNVVGDAAAAIGEELAPTITDIVVDATEFVKSISDIDKGVISTIASFLKWGAAISGIVASITAFLLGAIKVSAVITAIGSAFLPATVAASAFWVAITGPVGIAVAGIVALTAGVVALYNALDDDKPETIKELTDEITDLERQLSRLERQGASRARNEKIDQIKKEIKAYKDLRDAKQKSNDEFFEKRGGFDDEGTFLLRPQAEQAPNLGIGAFGIDGVAETQIPLTPEVQTDDAAEKVKTSQSKVTKVIDDETAKRIAKLKQANAEQRRIVEARGKFETDEEKNIAERKAAIENEKAAARRIENEQERALALEAINLKHQEELAAIEKQEEAIKAAKVKSAEEQKIIRDELRAEEVENRELLTEEDLVALEERLITEDELKQQFAQQEAQRVIDERNRFLADEEKFGATYAKLQSFFRNQEVQGAKSASGQLIQLSRSKNKSLSSIGRAAASVNAAIATGEGAIKAYSSLAGIPVVGPALGAAAAAALIAFGVEQQQQILAANTGGLVPSGLGRAGVDSVPAMLTPNELIAPAENFNEVVEGTAIARGFTPPEDETGEGSNGTVTVVLEPAGDFIGIIEQKQIEAEIQNTNVR